MLCAVNEVCVETEPQPVNHDLIISTPKSTKEPARRSDRGRGFLRSLMHLFRFVMFTASADVLYCIVIF